MSTDKTEWELIMDRIGEKYGLGGHSSSTETEKEERSQP